jgi:hypothetical protein
MGLFANYFSPSAKIFRRAGARSATQQNIFNEIMEGVWTIISNFMQT